MEDDKKLTKMFLNQRYEFQIHTADRIELSTCNDITTVGRKIIEMVKEFNEEHKDDALIVGMDTDSFIIQTTKPIPQLKPQKKVS